VVVVVVVLHGYHGYFRADQMVVCATF
jgi:hypothetical protein